MLFFKLEKSIKIKPVLSTKNLDAVIQAFISSWVDYCNSLFSVCSKLISLQLIEYAPARILTGIRNCKYITFILSSLHCLPVSWRVDFKILLVTFETQNGLVPSYISNLLTLLSVVTGPKVFKCCSSGGS